MGTKFEKDLLFQPLSLRIFRRKVKLPLKKKSGAMKSMGSGERNSHKWRSDNPDQRSQGQGDGPGKPR